MLVTSFDVIAIFWHNIYKQRHCHSLDQWRAILEACVGVQSKYFEYLL